MGGDPKFSKIVALQGIKYREMVLLQRPKFTQRGHFLEFSRRLWRRDRFKLQIGIVHHI